MSKYDRKTTEDYSCEICGAPLNEDEIGICDGCQDLSDNGLL